MSDLPLPHLILVSFSPNKSSAISVMFVSFFFLLGYVELTCKSDVQYFSESDGSTFFVLFYFHAKFCLVRKLIKGMITASMPPSLSSRGLNKGMIKFF